MDLDERVQQVPYAVPDLEQAAEAGVLGPRTARAEPLLARHLRRGVWLRRGRVVVMHNGPLTYEQQLWVAVLRAPAGTVLAGATAAVRRGLRWSQPLRPQVLSPFAGPLPALPGVSARRTRVLGPLDVHPTAQPPQLRLARAVLDQAGLVRRPDDLRALLAAPVQQRLLRVEHLLAVLGRLGPLRSRALVLHTLLDVQGGAQSLHELTFLRVLRQAGLPLPDGQVVREGPRGRRYLDAVWSRWCLHVEVDGLGHLLVGTWAADCDRSNELELQSTAERRLRVPGFWLYERAEHVVDQVRRGLLAGGWTP